MNEELVKKIEKYTILAMILVVIYVAVVNPFIKFKKNENTLKNAVKKYYEINEAKLPTGRRVATVTLQTLYDEKYIEENLQMPMIKSVCSGDKSWGKVTKVDSELKYYTYLECGMFKSKVDHEGPEIKLKGDLNMTIPRYGKFTDPGIESVYDKKDGEMSIKDVYVEGEVNTNENGTYEIKYTAFDSLKNKTTVVRKIKIVQVLKDTVKKETKTGYYVGGNPDNYIYFSNNLFRIIGVDGNNVKIVSDKDVGNVNYQGMDEYLKKYYDSLSPSSKKYIVKSKYCNDKLNGKDLSKTECSSYTEERDIYIPSLDLVNKTIESGLSYMILQNIDWTANGYDDKNAYALRGYFNDGNVPFYPQEQYNINGVRPIITIKGNVKIKSGNGSIASPYDIGDTDKGRPGDYLYTRYSGEYLSVDNELFRIVETKDKEATKVIEVMPIMSDEDYLTAANRNNKGGYNYNPKNHKSVAYYINNKVSTYIDGSYFVRHKIVVPSYKKHVIYGKETKTTEYSVKFFAPDAFDLYNINPYEDRDYWLLNETQTINLTYIMSEIGSIYDDPEYSIFDKHGIKVCGYLNKNITIVKGEGTQDDPYVVK